MKRTLRKSVIAAVLVGVMFVLAACGKKFDASAYVKSCLDLLTKGEIANYMEMTKRTKEEAEQDYTKNLDELMSGFEQLGLSGDLTSKYEEFFKTLLAKTKYTVLEAKEGDDKKNYKVDVEIEQLTGVFDGLQDELQDALLGAIEEGNLSSEEEMLEWVFEKMLEMLNSRLDSATYNEKQTVTVSVVYNETEKVYEIPDEDYNKLDSALIDISGLQ